MPTANHFRHQQYTNTAPTSPHRLLTLPSYPPVGSDEFARRMRRVGEIFRASNVAAIYLVHGTFFGADALGILTELGRIYPPARELAQRISKLAVDRVAGEAGNYTDRFAALFQEAINADVRPEIPVRRFVWSSENHHIGRADGAVRLLDEIESLTLAPPQRVLLWGHSHAGNVFALLTNLRAAQPDVLDQFFHAAQIYYRWPLLGRVDVPVWPKVHERLAQTAGQQPRVPLDLVTFGTPIRYGWDTGGYANLLHFVNHRPAAELPAYRAPFPPSVEGIMHAADGDYVQQLGIAGTNIMPGVISWRSWLADRRLNRLLQPEIGHANLLAHLRMGMRVAHDGTTLLVDYGPPEGNITSHIAGHAVYTLPSQLLFHAEEVARCFYEEE